MLNIHEIHPLTDFLRNHKAHVTRLKETHEPEVLTINGKAELVVQDAESYQRLIARLRNSETMWLLLLSASHAAPNPVVTTQEGMAGAEHSELPFALFLALMQAK
jgi:hypothetical protein